MHEQPGPGALDTAFQARFLAGLPPDLAASFTASQSFAIQQAFGRDGPQPGPAAALGSP